MPQRPPAFRVTVDGRLVEVTPASLDDTVADVALALGARAVLHLGRRALDPGQRIVDAGLVVGSALRTTRAPDDRSSRSHGSGDDGAGEDEPAARVEVAVVCGPSCSPWRPLPSGRHTIGRAPSAPIRLDDPDAELHHAVVEVAPDGAVTIVQLTGRVPITVDRTSPAETACRLGASRVVIRPIRPARADSLGGSIVRNDHDPWRRVVRRGPSPAPAPIPSTVPVPEPPADHPAPPALGLIGAATAAAGASIAAVVLGQALFALIAVVGASASVVTWGVGVLLARRRRSRAAATHRHESEGFIDALAAGHRQLEYRHRATHRDVVEVISAGDGEIWSRRLVDRAVTVTLGRGRVRVTAPIDPADRPQLSPEQLVVVERCEQLPGVAVPLRLTPGSITAVRGEPAHAAGLLRSIVAQLAFQYGPADLRPCIVTARPDSWRWASWLPHRGPDQGPIVRGVDDDHGFVPPDGGICVVVTDAPDLLTSRTGAFRRALDASCVATIVLVGPEHSVPAVCERVLDVALTGRARWTDGAVLDDSSIAVAGISSEEADRVARRLAPLTDPEDVAGGAAPAGELDLGDLDVPTDAPSIAARWRQHGHDAPLAATIGDSPEGTVEIDLVRDGPHGLIAGTTGSGKSELLRTLVVSLAARVGPDHVCFVLVDFKGGSTFDVCADLPHTVGVVTDLDDGLAERVLTSLDAEIRRRERRFRRDGVDDIAAARRCSPEPLPRLMVVVDEFATLAREHPGVLDGLVSIAQRGRSLGVHLLLATQRPAGVVTDDIRANTDLRLARRLQDRSDAIDVVDDARPARFPATTPGRALLRLGPDDVIVFQAACCTNRRRRDPGRLVVEVVEPDRGAGRPGPTDDDGPSTIETLVASIRQAAELLDVAAPHRPWIDPLPAVVVRADVGDDPDVIGIVDEPAEQRWTLLRWDRTSGNLLLVGPVGSGTTTALRTLAWSAIGSTAPGDCHLYVLDAHGEPGYDALGVAAHVGAVVRTVESERVDRLLRRLSTELDRRTDSGARRPAIVLLIDGLGALRTSLASVDRTDAATRLDRILRDGPACGIVTAAACDDSTAARLTSIGADRWDFVAPGRVRLAASALFAQLVADVPPVPDQVDATGGPPAITTLPEVVTPEALAACADPAEVPGPGAIAIGLGAADLSPDGVWVADGDHVLVAGAARTGVTTALRQLERGWRTLHPEGKVVRVDRTRRPDRCHLDGVVASAVPVLIAVDDADRVDDPDGWLASVVADRRPGLLVVAAGRLESIRGAYGHWTREVARSRCGLLMTSATDVDGDVLGTVLPRRAMIDARPGLAWVIDGRGHRLVQVAARMPG